MRVLVSGSRNFTDFGFLNSAMWDLYKERKHLGISLIIHGGAKGSDTLADEWAKTNKIPVEEYKADWNSYGKAAGPIRNKQMLEEGKPDLVIAFLAQGSKGTANMIKQAQESGVEVKVINI